MGLPGPGLDPAGPVRGCLAQAWTRLAHGTNRDTLWTFVGRLRDVQWLHMDARGTPGHWISYGDQRRLQIPKGLRVQSLWTSNTYLLAGLFLTTQWTARTNWTYVSIFTDTQGIACFMFIRGTKSVLSINAVRSIDNRWTQGEY